MGKIGTVATFFKLSSQLTPFLAELPLLYFNYIFPHTALVLSYLVSRNLHFCLPCCCSCTTIRGLSRVKWRIPKLSCLKDRSVPK